MNTTEKKINEKEMMVEYVITVLNLTKRKLFQKKRM